MSQTLPPFDSNVAERVLEKARGRRILCVGDVILDRYVYGAAPRVSREAPVLTVQERARDTMLGAVGNVARNVLALGARPILVAAIGEDAAGHAVSELLAAEPDIDVDLVVDRGRETGTKTRFIANTQQVLCVDRDPDGAMAQDVADQLLEAATAAVGDAELIILSDYGRGVVSPTLARAVIEAANAAGKPIVVDPRGRDFSRYDGATLLKPNAQELAYETGVAVETDAAAAEALTRVMATLASTDAVLLTRGAKGMALKRRGEEAEFFSAAPRDVYDVSGAGDTTIAALTVAMAAGAELEEAIPFANAAAGLVVTKVGTAVATPEELLADVEGRAAEGAGALSLEQTLARVKRWRAEGLRIGFTNGCFDVLHVGHLSLLNQARRMCDRLVVGLNDDGSVTRLKGPARPLNPLADRARLIAALPPVDAVTAFSDLTANALVEALKPDVYVKGGDYAHKPLPERAAVEACGGRVEIVPLEPGRSTTAIVERAQGG